MSDTTKRPAPSDITILAQQRHWPRVSLIQPTHRAGREIRQDGIRLKNLLTQAERKLEQSGVAADRDPPLLESARALVDDVTFWQQRDHGLGLFMDDEGMRVWDLPHEVEQAVLVSDEFLLRPLLPLTWPPTSCYVLALSLSEHRLIHITPGGVHEVTTQEAEQGMAASQAHVEVEKSMQFHTGTGPPGPGETRAAVFHGQGAAGDDVMRKKRVREYFEQIAPAVASTLRDEQAPLVLASVDWLQPIYQDVNEYPYLAEQSIMGNVDHWAINDLATRARTIMEKMRQDRMGEARATFEAARGTDRAVVGIEPVMKAALHGKIDLLILAQDKSIQGGLNDTDGSVQPHNEPERDDRELLNQAAVETLRRGGRALSTHLSEMPQDTSAAALLRY